MSPDLLKALREYIDAKCSEATHTAIHRSGSDRMSEDAWEWVVIQNDIETERTSTKPS